MEEITEAERQAASEAGRALGRIRSERKAAAARANGQQFGGRPVKAAFGNSVYLRRWGFIEAQGDVPSWSGD